MREKPVYNVTSCLWNKCQGCRQPTLTSDRAPLFYALSPHSNGFPHRLQPGKLQTYPQFTAPITSTKLNN